MRVSRLTRVSSRVRKPTVFPTGSPKSCAMREATARAATRRGSSSRIFLPPIQWLFIKDRGTMVLLPAPGGASSSTRRPRSSVWKSAGSAWLMGKSGRGGALTRRTIPQSARRLFHG